MKVPCPCCSADIEFGVDRCPNCGTTDTIIVVTVPDNVWAVYKQLTNFRTMLHRNSKISTKQSCSIEAFLKLWVKYRTRF
jgi:anaerobic ribonucleoside-triphosphate reductase